MAQSTQDRLRLKHLSRYYCAVSSVSPLAFESRDTTNHESKDDFLTESPRLCPDSTFTGLAQLAAFRLNCQRCFINIIDDTYQHIVAEATRSISAFDENDHDEGDGLLLGSQAVPIHHSICSYTLKVFTQPDVLKLHGPENSATEDHILITDLKAENAFDSSLKAFPPRLRYYLEVPIKGVSGDVIGSLCVIDDKPRHRRVKDIEMLKECAILVTHQFESARLREDHHRAERLVEGLAHFNTGKASISAWSKRTRGQQEIPEVYPDSANQSMDAMIRQDRAAERPPAMSVPSTEAMRSVSGTSDGPVSRPTTNTQTDQSEASAGSAGLTKSSGLDASYADTGFEPITEVMPKEDPAAGSIPSVAVRRTFSRAANLLRESMDFDASCFLEIPQNERYRGKRRRTSKAAEERARSDTNTSSSSSSEPPDSASDASPSRRRTSTDKGNGPTESMCHRLGFSTRVKSSLAGSSATKNFLSVSAELMGQLTVKYPRGHIFQFDSFGSLSSGEDGHESERRDVKHGRKQGRAYKLTAKLFELFPDVRSLIFLPLYDNDKQQLYAGFIGCSDDVTRGLDKSELTYVSGFCNSVMCEVMRLEAMATDKAKSDFISSISHELRSPLHGILAACELLTEQEAAAQSEFLRMINTCARTLLDVMDHLLDHAKINRFISTKPKSATGTNKNDKGSDTSSLTKEIDLLSLLEETTSSIAAGNNWSRNTKQSSDMGHSKVQTSEAAETEQPENGTVPIILNIARNDDWRFLSEAGSWRRIIMNILGNSLKYTQKGQIQINLSLIENSQRPGRTTVQLKVTDTGQGISEEYLKHRLYTPFSQENNLSHGAGLGLSLVRQIVSSLHGYIEIHSEVGTGTEVCVTVPMRRSNTPAGIETTTKSPQSRLPVSTRRYTVRLCGFNHEPPINEQPTGLLDPSIKALMLLKDSLSGLLVDWFDLKIAEDDSDLQVIEEGLLDANLADYDQSENNILVVSVNGRGSRDSPLTKANHVYISPPIGPLSMSEALRSLLAVAKDRRRTSPPPFRDLRENLDSSSSQVDHGDISESTLPGDLQRRQSPSKENIGPHAIPGYGPSKAVLLVDDNDINLRILVAVVKKLKVISPEITFFTARNGREALDKYVEQSKSGTPIGVIFMDLTMPVMTGFESTRAIRTFEKQRGLTGPRASTIVAITGLWSADAQREIESSGFDIYLRKPVRLQVIKDLLNENKLGMLQDGYVVQ